MEDVTEYMLGDEFYTLEEYNRKVLEMKENWINKKKLSLIGDLLMMRVGQIAAFISVPAIMFIVWDKFYTNDILYLCGWWAIIGCPVAFVIATMIGEGIKGYKNNQLRKIYRTAHKKFDTMIIEEEEF